MSRQWPRQPHGPVQGLAGDWRAHRHDQGRQQLLTGRWMSERRRCSEQRGDAVIRSEAKSCRCNGCWRRPRLGQPFGDKVSSHLCRWDMAKDDFAGGDALQQDVVPPEEVAGAGGAAGKGADAHVGKNGASGVREHKAVDVAIAPSGVGMRNEIARSRLRDVDVHGEARIKAGRGGESGAAVGDADVLFGVHNGKGGEGDILGLSGRGGHYAGQAMEEEGETRVQELDELEGADNKLLGAHLLRVEFGGRGRDQGHAVGDVGEVAASGKAGESTAVEELGEMSSGGLIDLLWHGELEQAGGAVAPDRVSLEGSGLGLVADVAVAIGEDGAEGTAGAAVERGVFGEEEVVDDDEHACGTCLSAR
eukprot:scaffold15324_cov112-Isochrysis_galbana.AAC.2